MFIILQYLGKQVFRKINLKVKSIFKYIFGMTMALMPAQFGIMGWDMSQTETLLAQNENIFSQVCKTFTVSATEQEVSLFLLLTDVFVTDLQNVAITQNMVSFCRLWAVKYKVYLFYFFPLRMFC